MRGGPASESCALFIRPPTASAVFIVRVLDSLSDQIPTTKAQLVVPLPPRFNIANRFAPSS